MLGFEAKEQFFDIEQKDSSGFKVLHHACFMGRFDVVKYLLTSHDLRYKADIESHSDDLKTPLIIEYTTLTQ